MRRTRRYFGGDSGCADSGKWADLTCVWEAASNRPAAEPDVRAERGGSDCTEGMRARQAQVCDARGDHRAGLGECEMPLRPAGEVAMLHRLSGEGILPGDETWESQALGCFLEALGKMGSNCKVRPRSGCARALSLLRASILEANVCSLSPSFPRAHQASQRQREDPTPGRRKGPSQLTLLIGFSHVSPVFLSR